MSKQIRVTYMEGRGDPLEDLVCESKDDNGDQLPVYMIANDEELVIYYSNEPFTLEEAVTSVYGQIVDEGL